MRYGFCSEGSSCLTEETRYIHTNSKMCCAVLVFSRSVVPDSATPWTVARQAPLSMGFSRQEYWSGLPCPPPGDLPHLGIEPRSPALQADCSLSGPPGNSEYQICHKAVTKMQHRQ